MSHISFLSNEYSFYDDSPLTYAFADAEAAWFWCVKTSEAIHGGAQMRGGASTMPRPCEAVDTQKIVLRLAREKILTDRQVAVLVKYGAQWKRPTHRTDSLLWKQAMTKMTPILQHKGIIA